jgi:NAD+ synthase
VPYLFVNQVGGQDELVFDGASYAVDFDGTEHQLLGDFVTGTALVAFDGETHQFSSEAKAELTSGWEAEYRAAVMALGDYVNKNRFPGVVLGMSGGIDSRADGGHRRGRAGRRPRVVRDAAVEIYVL